MKLTVNKLTWSFLRVASMKCIVTVQVYCYRTTISNTLYLLRHINVYAHKCLRTALFPMYEYFTRFSEVSVAESDYRQYEYYYHACTRDRENGAIHNKTVQNT